MVTGDTVEYACSEVTNEYPEAPAQLIEVISGISAVNAALPRGRIVISVIPES